MFCCIVWGEFIISFKIFSTGTITSSSPTAQPAEVLLQATPPHRRARSAAWSYIFLPEEAWCDLTIHLPAAVLLKEIHIQPHLASLASKCILQSIMGTTAPPLAECVAACAAACACASQWCMSGKMLRKMVHMSLKTFLHRNRGYAKNQILGVF